MLWSLRRRSAKRRARIEEGEAALQSPNLPLSNEDIIREYLARWYEIIEKIKKMLLDSKEAMNKLRTGSGASPSGAGGGTSSNTQSASSMVPSVLAAAAEAAESNLGTPKANATAPTHLREASFSSNAVSFVDSADTVDAIARDHTTVQATAPSVMGILVYFNIVAQGQTPTLVAASSPSNTPALLDATPSKTGFRERANSSSPPGSAISRAISPPLITGHSSSSPHGGGDKALTDHFDDIYMAVEKLLVKLEKMETCTGKLLKSIDSHPDQHELRSAEMRPFVKDFVRMKPDDF